MREFEETEFKLTSGIPGKHGRGGCSEKRFTRKREEEVNAFLRKVHFYARKLPVEKWILQGDKEIVKRFKRLNWKSPKVGA